MITSEDRLRGVLAEGRTDFVQSRHGVHRTLIGFADIVFADHRFNAIPSIGILNPLMGVHGDLRVSM